MQKMDVSSNRAVTGAVQIKHKKQSSQDSGTFLDWDEGASVRQVTDGTGELNFNSNVTGEFVTVVAVESKDRDEVDNAANNFVTVLTVNSTNLGDSTVGDKLKTDVNIKFLGTGENGERSISNEKIVSNNEITQQYTNSNEVHQSYSKNGRSGFENCGEQFTEREILVYRLPGERLGFGLKFEGGLQTNHKVQRLFVQSCAEDSPASRTQTPWGKFCPGDEILRINNIDIRELTRMDCVKYLKESTVVLKLYVRHLKSTNDAEIEDSYDQNGNKNNYQNVEKIVTNKHSGENRQGDKPRVPNEVKAANSSIAEKADSSPPPIPPRKLIKKSSAASGSDKSRASPKASPRSMVNTSKGKNANHNEKIKVNDQTQDEYYEVDLKLSDQDIDEIIDSLDKTENEEALRNSAQSENGLIRNEIKSYENVSTNGKHTVLDINDNLETVTGLPHKNDHDLPEAEFYTNLFDNSDTMFESESDDTGSSHTTAIDRLSLHSSDRISLTSSSSFSDIKSLNSYEFDLDSNMETIIDFDKVLEPLEGSAEALPNVVQRPETEGLYGPFLRKTQEEQSANQKCEQENRNVSEVGKEPNRSQDVTKLKSHSETKLQSPKPLPRTEIQKLKFKSGKKMPPPPPPPGKKTEAKVEENVNKSSIESLPVASPKNNDKYSVQKKNDDVAERVENESVTDSVKESSEKNVSLSQTSKPIQETGIGNMKNQQNKQGKINENDETNLYTTVEQISIVDHYPKVVKAQEKLSLDDQTSNYKQSGDLSILETIVENDEQNNHLPRLIDFVPKDKIKSSSTEKSKKINSIIYEQQKVVEYFTTQHTATKTQSKIKRESNESKCGTTKHEIKTVEVNSKTVQTQKENTSSPKTPSPKRRSNVPNEKENASTTEEIVQEKDTVQMSEKDIEEVSMDNDEVGDKCADETKDTVTKIDTAGKNGKTLDSLKTEADGSEETGDSMDSGDIKDDIAFDSCNEKYDR